MLKNTKNHMPSHGLKWWFWFACNDTQCSKKIEKTGGTCDSFDSLADLPCRKGDKLYLNFLRSAQINRSAKIFVIGDILVLYSVTLGFYNLYKIKFRQIFICALSC